MTPIEQAKAYALQQAGLDWEKRNDWSDADRSAYLRANAQFRRENPGLFNLAELAAAGNYESVAATKSPDFSYVEATADALGERLGEIGEQVSGVGEGIFSGLSLTRWLIPLALVAFVAIALWKFAGSPTPSRRKAAK